ncbi:MFS transporter [Bdellovibrio sp. 22V]|uniref:MFS transporter n=1 Tax=Bdellovibrio sp. 22V TaxID=3044166 RepID=UPI0025438896|nr:MFS transporter [Bdellovibrio sp. 22V]WII71362.1 MFS transporter [Bdellovibrio sp. 22V]
MQQAARPNMAFTGYQKFIIALLAFLQFTIILDFMILSPLGAFLMPALKINTSQFGTVVSAYAISSAISGFLTAGFADKFDRKRLLLFFYGGFIIGTFLCGIAPTFEFLLGARIVTGLFGGVIGSIVFAIMTDLFPLEQRGRVMGFLQTAFAASQVLGLPAGLFLTNHWGWHMPFMMIVVVSLLAGIAIVFYMKPLRGHLALQTDKKAYQHLLHTVQVPSYLFAFLATGLLSLGGFMIMPFASAFTVNNLGIHADELPLIYFVTGIASILIGPFVGKMTDTFGKYKVFVFGSFVSIVMVLIYTHLGATPLYMVMLVNTAMFIGIFSRMIPSQALMSAIPTPANRGAFMSVSSSLQSLAGGIGSIVAGAIVVQASTGEIQHFDIIGYIMCVIAIVCMVMMYYINRSVMRSQTSQAQLSN